MSEKKTVAKAAKGAKAKSKAPPKIVKQSSKETVQDLPLAPSLTSSLQIAPSLTQSVTKVADVASITTTSPLAIAGSLSTPNVIPAAISKPVAPTGRKSAPTVDSIIQDPITQIASQHWAPDGEVIYFLN
jgi:hypothetical protein